MLAQAPKKVPNACLRTLGQLSTPHACTSMPKGSKCMLAHALSVSTHMLAQTCHMHFKRFQMHACTHLHTRMWPSYHILVKHAPHFGLDLTLIPHLFSIFFIDCLKSFSAVFCLLSGKTIV